MAAKHEELPKTAQPGRDMTATWNQARLGMLEQQVHHLQSENSKLQGEKKTLEAEVNSLVESLLSEKAFLTKVKIKADRHLDALHCLLHTEGCGCIGQCEQGHHIIPNNLQFRTKQLCVLEVLRQWIDCDLLLPVAQRWRKAVVFCLHVGLPHLPW
jgi:hypothetical protein